MRLFCRNPARCRRRARRWSGRKAMQKLQTQGVHHITLVGADRQIDDRFLGGRARHALRLRAAQSRRARGEPSLFRSRRRAADHHLHQRDRASPTRRRTRPRSATSTTSPSTCRMRPSPRRWSGSTSAASATAGSKDRGFMDSIYFRDPLGQLYELASYRFEPPAGRQPCRGAARGASASASRAATTTSAKSISPTRSRRMIRRDRGSLSADRAPKDPYAKAVPKSTCRADRAAQAAHARQGHGRDAKPAPRRRNSHGARRLLRLCEPRPRGVASRTAA